MFQMGGVGPMLGQAHHFRHLRAGKDRLRDRALHQRGQAPLRRDRQAARAKPVPRRPRVLDRRHRHLPVAAHAGRTRASSWTTIRTCKAWFDEIAARPAVQRGVEVLADLRRPITGDKEREILFGKTQYERR